MGFVPESGGLVLGRRDSPQLDIIPVSGPPFGPGRENMAIAMAHLLAAMTTEIHFLDPQHYPEFFQPSRASPSKHFWVVLAKTEEEAYLLRFGFQSRPLEDLRIIEKEVGGLTASLLAPFVLLAWMNLDPRTMTREERARAQTLAPLLVFLLHRHKGRRAERLSAMDRQLEIPRMLRALWSATDLESAMGIFDHPYASGTDVVLLALELGKTLWVPESLPEPMPTPAGFYGASVLAEIVGEGVGLMPWPVQDWGLWFDLIRTRNSGRPLPPPDWSPPVTGYTRGLEIILGEAPSANPDLARGLYRAFMEIATRNARYIPSGRFRVRVPELAVFRRPGVSSIRISADPHGLWIQLEGEKGSGEIFRFDRDLPPRPDLSADPVWLAVFAALWHDMTVGVPRASRRKDQETRGGEAMTADEATVVVRDKKPLVLPRTFVVREEAGQPGPSDELDVDWGGHEERSVIRAIHAVRGHLRRLPPGWKPSPEAIETAQFYGVVLPEGYTFVRPHTRGIGKEAETPAERVAIARGLRSLALLG